MSRRLFFILLVTVFLVVSAATIAAGPEKADTLPSVMLPAGYRMEQVASGLTFPTSVTWDENGRMYVLEAGSAPGPKAVGSGRVLRIDGDAKSVVLDGLIAPASDVKFLNGEMYVAHRGTLSVVRGGARVDLITDLPWGDYSTGEIAFKDGWVYLGNGTVTNSGIVGDDNFVYGWPFENPRMSDVPAESVTLKGLNFISLDLRTAGLTDTTSTGAFSPFGTPTSEGQVVAGNVKSSGSVLRVRTDGTGLETYAWGLRNPFGLRFSPAGDLIATDQGYDDRGSRPVANAPDAVYAVKQGAWYGWPDYAAGAPVTDSTLSSTRYNDRPLSMLLDGTPVPATPLAKLAVHTGAMKFDFAPFGFDTQTRMFIASFGETDPLSGAPAAPAGSSILAYDMKTGRLEAFAYNRAQAPAGRSLFGLNHPIDVKFGPDGFMYVVDYGVYEINGQTANAVPGTGVVWRIMRQRSEYEEFSSQARSSLAGILGGGDPWTPDYTALQKKLTDFTGTLGASWGIFFKDLTSGRTMGVNPTVQVPAASCVKVPVVLYASNLASQGKLDWNQRLEYRVDRDWQGGAGSLQYTAKDGDTFSLRELAEKAIRESDNVAWKMLEKYLGKGNIAAFMSSVGGKTVYPGGQNVSTPEDLATYMQAALDFSKVSHEGDKLLYDLAHTIWNTGLNRYITEATVAHKEGDVTGVSNDVGLVYAKHPYIVAIMSDGQGDIELGFEHIGEISRIIFDYQNGSAGQAAPAAAPATP